MSLSTAIFLPETTKKYSSACPAPGIIIGERFGIMPEIFVAGDQYSPAMFTNDELRIKARHFLNVLVADFRPLYKANVP